MTRQDVFDYVLEQYGTEPEYLWANYPGCAVLRNPNGSKWYGLVTDIPKKKLGLPGEGSVDILNLKCGPALLGSLLGKEGYFPAYHMNKENWVSVRLDGAVPREDICWLIDISYDLTRPKGRKKPEKLPSAGTPGWS